MEQIKPHAHCTCILQDCKNNHYLNCRICGDFKEPMSYQPKTYMCSNPDGTTCHIEHEIGTPNCKGIIPMTQPTEWREKLKKLEMWLDGYYGNYYTDGNTIYGENTPDKMLESVFSQVAAEERERGYADGYADGAEIHKDTTTLAIETERERIVGILEGMRTKYPLKPPTANAQDWVEYSMICEKVDTNNQFIDEALSAITKEQ
jgi:hypothetical protein